MTRLTAVPIRLKAAIIALYLACSMVPALAANQLVDLSSGAGSFIGTSPLLQDGDDEIAFVNLEAGTYDFLLSLSSQNISGLTATLNGQAANMLTSGRFSFGDLESNGASPFTLVLTGVAGSRALYSGELTVTAVPEPATYALLLPALGAGAFAARRRRVNKAAL